MSSKSAKLIRKFTSRYPLEAEMLLQWAYSRGDATKARSPTDRNRARNFRQVYATETPQARETLNSLMRRAVAGQDIFFLKAHGFKQDAKHLPRLHEASRG